MDAAPDDGGAPHRRERGGAATGTPGDVDNDGTSGWPGSNEAGPRHARMARQSYRLETPDVAALDPRLLPPLPPPHRRRWRLLSCSPGITTADNDGTGPTVDFTGAGGERSCVDKDGDGYGDGCIKGSTATTTIRW